MNALMEVFIQNILVASIFALKLAQAMDIRVDDLAIIRSEPARLLWSVVVVVVLAPLVTLAVVLAVHPPRATEIGLAVAAASPAAPLFISSAVGAGGRVPYVASLLFILSLLAVLTTPVTLEALARILGFDAEISSLAVARQVAVALFLPTCLGMAVRARLPNFADRIAPILRKVGGLIFLLVVLLVIAKTYHLLLAFDLRSYLAVILVVAAALAVGQLTGPPRREDRTTLALACASRNTGLAMLIASLNFPSAGAIHVLIPYLFASGLPSMLYVQWRKNRSTLPAS